MAQTQPFTYAQIIAAAQLTALNSPTPPTPGSQQYLIFVNYIILAIIEWEGQRNVLWRELWTDQPNYATIAANTTSIALPDDFKFLGGGFIRVTYPGGTAAVPSVRAFPVKRLPEIELNPHNIKREFYVTGNVQEGFSLVFGWTPQVGDPEIGATISFRYYAFAATPQLNSLGILSNPNDMPQMSEPSYAYKKVTSLVAAANYNLNLYTIYDAQALDGLTQMIQANEMGTDYQDDYVKDVDALLGQGGRIPSKFNSSYYTGNWG